MALHSKKNSISKWAGYYCCDRKVSLATSSCILFMFNWLNKNHSCTLMYQCDTGANHKGYFGFLLGFAPVLSVNRINCNFIMQRDSQLYTKPDKAVAGSWLDPIYHGYFPNEFAVVFVSVKVVFPLDLLPCSVLGHDRLLYLFKLMFRCIKWVCPQKKWHDKKWSYVSCQIFIKSYSVTVPLDICVPV